MVSFRIRSIYDIALINLLTRKLGYSLAQPTTEQSKIFNKENNLEAYDIEIEDILGGYGIKVEGDEEYVDEIINSISDNVPTAIILVHPVQLHAIYHGQVVHVNYDKNLSIIDIGEKVNAILFNSNYRKGQKVIVQVNELNVLGDQLPMCSDVIHFPGQHAILERDARFVRVSRKLPKETRDELFERGKKLRPRDHGLILRTSAASVSDEELKEEIKDLLDRSMGLDLLISGSSYGPGILQPGQTVAHILFVKDAKAKLDSVRNEVVPTLPNFHWFMSYSNNLKLTTTFAERISQKVDPALLATVLKELLLEKDFADNMLVKQQEYSLSSVPTIRIVGQLNWVNDKLVIKRSFRSSRGKHYAINVDIVVGDTVTTFVKEGSWTIHTKVYRDNKILGEYIKIVTPVELYNEGYIRYIDLGIILLKVDDEVRVIDSKELIKLSETGIISKTFSEKIYALAEKCEEEFRNIDVDGVVILDA